jgi:hypothetical protein
VHAETKILSQERIIRGKRDDALKRLQSGQRCFLSGSSLASWRTELDHAEQRLTLRQSSEALAGAKLTPISRHSGLLEQEHSCRVAL